MCCTGAPLCPFGLVSSCRLLIDNSPQSGDPRSVEGTRGWHEPKGAVTSGVRRGGDSNMTYTSAPILQPNDAFKSWQGAAGVRENRGEPWEPVNGTIHLLSGWNIQLWLLHCTLTRHNVTASVICMSTWKAVPITTHSIWFWTHVISHNAEKYVNTYIHVDLFNMTLTNN